jgi:adenine-specific DNA-methyltransferase
VHLIKRVLEHATGPTDVILDFFAGSGTTAQAVMQINAEDGGSRRFILVQLPEVADPKSEAFKAGYPNIADITKERIRRAGQKIAGERTPLDSSVDIGFRVLRLDTSNMKDVYYAPDEVKQADLVAHADNIKEERTSEDLLFQVLVDWGVDLTLPIARETIEGNTVFFVDGNALAACFDPKVSEDLVKELAKRKPLRAVFRDSSYDSDSVKINVEQVFKLLSPETEVKSL